MCEAIRGDNCLRDQVDPVPISDFERSVLPKAVQELFIQADQMDDWCSAKHDDSFPSEAYLGVKRVFDIVASSLGLIVLSPVLVGAGAAVKFTSDGPIIFKQQRYGKDNIPFTCYKFRSMKVDTPDNVPTAEMKENPSVMTPIGSFLRKTSIDELPQLFNIVKGDMSVIGPRPMILSEYEQIQEREKYGATAIRPGLTGWAQVNGRDAVSIQEKARLDGEYRNNMSVAMDLKILLKSVPVVLSRSGYSDGAIRCEDKETNPDIKARLLVVTQHYWPEPFNFADICEGLVERGYEVTVLTGLPNYPEGKLYPEYREGRNRLQMRNGVRIVRAPLIPRGSNPIQRVINYYSFPFGAKRRSHEIDCNFDIVIAFQSSPVMQAEPAAWIAEQTGAPLLHYVIDIWPECLCAGGIKKNSKIYRHYSEVSKRIYSKADKLALTSPMFKGYLENMMGKEVNSFYLPQYAEEEFGNLRNDIRPDGFNPAKINLTFAGNVGSAQSVETLVCAAAILNNDSRFVFHVIGSGSQLDACKKLAIDLGASENLMFHGRHDISEMPAYYAASDAMIATFEDNPVLGLTLPRKIQSYMAAGRPVIAAVAGEAQRVISEAKCGFCCRAEDAEGLALACLKLACLDSDQRKRLGDAGRSYYQAHFSKERFFCQLDKQLQEMKGLRHGA